MATHMTECVGLLKSILLVLVGAIWLLPAGLLSAVPPAGPGQPRVAQRPRPVRVPNPNDPQAADDESLLDGVFLPPDRVAKQRLERARQMLDDRRYGESVRYLGMLLEGSEDYFFKPDPAQTVYRSLKAEAGAMIGAMPTEGRDSYELQFGARSRRLLAEAVQGGDMAAVADVARRFFYTKAGAEATMLVGRHHLDHGRPLAAALCFERLHGTPGAGAPFEPALSMLLATCWLRSENPDRAKQVLIELKRSQPGSELRLAGQVTKLFDNEQQSLEWLTRKVGNARDYRQSVAGQVTGKGQWTLFRGDAARNAPSDGSVPLLNVRWRQRTSTEKPVEDIVAQLRQQYLDQDVAALPSLHPLAVDKTVLMRTTHYLQGVDFETGKRVWRYPSGDGDDEESPPVSLNPPNGAPGALAQSVEQRIWDDATFGTLSSDGENVYFVDDPELLAGFSRQPMVWAVNGRPRTFPKSSNRLTSLELKSEGKLRWKVGGVTGEDEPKLAGAFFLGPPLPLLGKLYVIAETKGQEIRLLVLSAKTGLLEWSQQLAFVEQSIALDPFRRNAGVSPSFADGVLVCPTAAGAVVALDLTTRSLLWGYQYPRSQQASIDRLNAMRLNFYQAVEPRLNDRWMDSTVTIAGGKVLVTPLEGDQLYCLNLLDGQVIWKQDRGRHLYVGCVKDQTAVLIGHHDVAAVKLTDGSSAWPEPIELPSGAIPSGRGFYSDDHYYLPLSTAEVAKINIASGKIQQRAKSRSGSVPGNLICFQGNVISQGPDFVEVYYQLDTLKSDVAHSLKNQPENPKALAHLGEIKLDEGKLAEAIALFRRSFEKDGNDYARDLLVESLLIGLRNDFASNRSAAQELEKLIEEKHQKIAYLRLMAAGLQQVGEISAAFEACMRLVEQQPENADLDELGDDLFARRDRWLRARFGQLRSAAGEEPRKQIDEAVLARLQTAETADTADALRRFLRFFGDHPSADDAREKLVTKLMRGEPSLESEFLLRRLLGSTDEGRVRRAIARMALLLKDGRRPELAVPYYRALADKWADVECLDGKTGRQLVEALPPRSELRSALGEEKPWPVGLVKPHTGGVKRTAVPRTQRMYDLEIHGDTAPFFTTMTVAYDQQQPAVVGQDGLGVERFRYPLLDPMRRSQMGAGFTNLNNPALNHATVNGNLLVLFVGYQVLAFDTQYSRSGNTNGLVWVQDLGDQLRALGTTAQIQARQVNPPWCGPRYIPTDAASRPVGTMGPVGFDGVFVQRMRDLMCVQPLTGEVLWIRKNVPAGCHLFGDEEVLLAAPPDGAEALVLSAIDGELLGKRHVAPFDQRIALSGRKVLEWRPLNGKPAIALRDPWKEQDIWSHDFEPGVKATLVGQESLAAMEPSGHFRLLRLADGEIRIEEQLEPEHELTSIFLLPSNDQYLLLANSQSRGNANVTPIPNLMTPLVNGKLYAFDRHSGKRQWPEPAAVKQQGLVPSQPSELPLLIFARQVHRPNGAGGQRVPKTSVTCVDKRTGQVAYETAELPVNANTYEVSADRSKSAVELQFPGQSITLELTNEPIPPKPPATPEPPKAKGIAGAIFKALGNAAQRVSGLPTVPDQDDDDP